MTEERDACPPDPAPFLSELRAARFAFGLECPRCNGRRVHRWGTFLGRQRYRCRSCRRTFSDLTGTPAYHAKKLALWPEYAQCLRLGLSIRRAAARTGIHPTSAFRWRHLLLSALRVCDDEETHGWTEVEHISFAHSRKGVRGLGREARQRGPRPGYRRRGERVPVIIACDRIGAAISIVLRPGMSGMRLGRRIDELLGPRLSPNTVLVARHGGRGPFAVVARLRGLAFRECRRRGSKWKLRLAHTETALDYCDRLLEWIRRFRGVATRYLPNYLVWHRAIDAAHRRGIARTVLRWPVQQGPD